MSECCSAGGFAADRDDASISGRPAAERELQNPVTQLPSDLESTRIGRLLSDQVVRAGLKRAATEFPDPDEATIAMIRAAVREGTERGAVLMTGGAVSFEAMDRAIEVINGEAKLAVRRIWDRRRS